MIDHMKQILVQLDERTASLLEAAVPAKSRKRSEFIRQAIARALLDVAEVRTRAAYLRSPADPTPFDPTTWADPREALRPTRQPRKKRP